MASEIREYKLRIDPKILRLLGPNLYTNIYYVLAELISNAYDADAKNVYIISKPDSIVVEDDGKGMDYNNGVKKYLNVAEESRTNESNSYTKLKRRKMGRKGVGKLSALSVSEKVLVKTKMSGIKSGFILSREIKEDGILEPLTDPDITFDKVDADHATSIVMQNPRYVLNKTIGAVKKNLLKIFPLINDQFRIHIILDDHEEIIDSFDKEITSQLCSLIILGNEFHHLNTFFKNEFSDKEKQLIETRNSKEIPMLLKTKIGEEKEYKLIIKGWIGTYRSTKDRKINLEDFPDNFISLFSNQKLGEYNILPIVGKNKLIEVFVVGQLYVDLFEETELPDMALSNRQGYKNDDPRYLAVINYVRDALLEEALDLRKTYTDYRDEVKEKSKLDRQKEKEEELNKSINEYKKSLGEKTMHEIASFMDKNTPAQNDAIQRIVEGQVNALLPVLGLKTEVDSLKKRILISHTKSDKFLADVIYKMLIFNNIPPEDIIYTSCDEELSRLPNKVNVYDYLRQFFVESRSKQGIYVIFVTSKEMRSSWGAPIEAGAGWITQVAHQIFTIHSYRPEEPLNTKKNWHTSVWTNNQLNMSSVEWDAFAVKIEEVCDELKYAKKSRKENKDELKRYILVT